MGLAVITITFMHYADGGVWLFKTSNIGTKLFFPISIVTQL